MRSSKSVSNCLSTIENDGWIMSGYTSGHLTDYFLRILIVRIFVGYNYFIAIFIRNTSKYGSFPGVTPTACGSKHTNLS